MQLSIVTTLYRSAPHIDVFYRRVRDSAEQLNIPWELVMVNDGSPDNSLELAIALHQRDPHVRVVDLSRNFGHHQAALTGLRHARGELIFFIDSDLEEAPELLLDFHRRFQQEQVDVVYGVQQRRKGGWFERYTGNLFFAVFNRLSSVKIPPNIISARLMTRRYVDALLMHREREVFMAGLWMSTGFDQAEVRVSKQDKGDSVYTLRRKLALLANSVTSFSNRPLVYIFYIGLLMSVLSSLYVAQLVIRKLFFDITVDGWTSLIVSIWLLGGLIILFLGVIGIYLSKVFMEVKQRPLTIVRSIYEDQRASP